MITAIANTVLGSNKSSPRIWLDGVKLERAGFRQGDQFTVTPDIASRELTIAKTEASGRTVSRKKRSFGFVPVIDVNNKSLSAIFGAHKLLKVVFAFGLITVKLHPTALAEEERTTRLAEVASGSRPLMVGSLPHGGGIMDHAIEAGLKQAGIQSNMAFGLDMNGNYLDISLRNNPVWKKSSVSIESRIEDLDLADLPKVDMLVAGIPCTGASLSGRAKLKLKYAEHHESAGAFFHHFLNVVDTCSPWALVIENVVPYKNTPGYFVLRSQLERKGYTIFETTVHGHEHGALEKRKRFVMIALTKGVFFSGHIAATAVRPATVGTILEQTVSEDAYKDLSYLDRKQERDIEAGKGFRTQRVTADSTSISTLGTGYAKWRSTESHVSHPTKDGFARLLTPLEHARAKTVPIDLIKDVAPTVAHEILGQSVIYNAFVAVGAAVGEAITKDRTETAGQGLPLFEVLA